MNGRVPRAAGIAFEPRAEGVETMGLDVIGILSILVAILGVGVPMGGLALRGIGNLKKDFTKITDRLSGQIESVQKRTEKLSGQIESVKKELRDELKGEVAGLKGDIAGLRDRIDAVHSEVVEGRVVMSDRVARLEGRVFGVTLPDTGTDRA